eukprot:COSAG03_NODE_26555_length_258_cov_0.974843_1_plen_63_part_10
MKIQPPAQDTPVGRKALAQNPDRMMTPPVCCHHRPFRSKQHGAPCPIVGRTRPDTAEIQVQTT